MLTTITLAGSFSSEFIELEGGRAQYCWGKDEKTGRYHPCLHINLYGIDRNSFPTYSSSPAYYTLAPEDLSKGTRTLLGFKRFSVR